MDEKKAHNLGGQLNSSRGYEPAPKVDPQKAAEEFDKIKTKLDDFKKNVIKKYNYTVSISLLPGNSFVMFEDDEQLPKEIIDSKPLHVMMIIPEDHYKDIPKIKPEIVKMAKETGENLWIHIKTPVDIWNYGLDSKFEFLDAVAASFPVYDKGYLGALRIADIHKSLVLRKFEKYVASYVIAGSLVRGTASKDSDVDVFVIIDDTDVKRMARIELLEKLRGIVYDYIREATALSGVKNILNVQVYLLTDFWMSVKDAHPVMFTFIRDGIPLHDRGTFIPWKLLLQMGKIKPSTEAIDLYMKEGDRTEEMVKRRQLDAMVDCYYGIVTPTQALMMMLGEAPPVPKVLAQEARKVFVDREKLMSDKDIKILEKAIHLFKQYEYGKLKEYPGKEVDQLLQECKDYNKRMKELRKKIEKRVQEKTAAEINKEVFGLLKIFFGNKNNNQLVKDFDDKLVKKGKMEQRFSRIMKEITLLDKKVKSDKFGQKDIDSAKKDAIELIDSLTEYGQRADLLESRKGTMQIILSNNRKAELVLVGNDAFVIEGQLIKKVHSGKLVLVSKEDFEKIFNENKGKLTTKVSNHVFETLKHELGDFELAM
jgi:predicted nucleotidyltransferase